MTVFDQLFFGVFNYYKRNKNKHAKNIAIWYISIVQILLVFILGAFFSEFFKQMNVASISNDKAITLLVIASIFLLFKNWLQYSGKKLTVRKAKKSNTNTKGERSIYTLWLIPIVLIGFSLILINVFL